MSRHTSLAALCLALGLAASAHAQFGFSIGGGGAGFSIGRGGYYGPGYYRPGYYGPGYYRGYGRSGVGVRVGNFGYYDYDDDYYGRPYYYARPQVNYYVLPSNTVQPQAGISLPSNKVAPTKLKLSEGDILVRSPAYAPASVGYGVNDRWVYTMKPGERQKLAAGRTWTIEFDRGIDGAEPARYTLDSGIYEFSYSEEAGWELHRVSDSVLPTPAEASDNAELPAEAPPSP